MIAAWVAKVETPAFVIDERRVMRELKTAARLRDDCGFKLLYALKPLTFEFVLELMTGWVDGFATSSLFESRLAREVIGTQGTVHVTTPGFRAVARFTSWAIVRPCRVQFAVAVTPVLPASSTEPGQVGLRVNPQLSLVDDPRYDPCRRHSKLGVPSIELAERWRRRPELFDELGGLLFHTNCDSSGFEPLHRTVIHLEAKLGDLLSRLLDQPGGRLSVRSGRAGRFACRSGSALADAARSGCVHRAGCLARAEGRLSGRDGDRLVPGRGKDDRRARYHGQPCARGLRVPVRARRSWATTTMPTTNINWPAARAWPAMSGRVCLPPAACASARALC